MKLSDVGERALVELTRELCSKGPGVVAGIGDDAAVLKIDGRCLVATTDMLVAKTHFPPGTTAKQIGHKAVVANLSDLAAMGAEPLALVFSVGLPRTTEVSFVRQLLRGMDTTARAYQTYVVGGDLDESEDITIVGTAFGLASKEELMLRSGARPGNLVAVTGTLGAAAAGLKILQKGLPKKRYGELVKAQLEPIARVREGRILARSGFVTSAIDITDGLASNLWQLARESKIRFVIERERLPEHRLVRRFAAEHGFEVDDLVLFVGEDFELLFTVRPKGWERIRRALERIGTRATAIGCVERGKGVFVRKGEKTRRLPDRGYEHFR